MNSEIYLAVALTVFFVVIGFALWRERSSKIEVSSFKEFTGALYKYGRQNVSLEASVEYDKKGKVVRHHGIFTSRRFFDHTIVYVENYEPVDYDTQWVIPLRRIREKGFKLYFDGYEVEFRDVDNRSRDLRWLRGEIARREDLASLDLEESSAG